MSAPVDQPHRPAAGAPPAPEVPDSPAALTPTAPGQEPEHAAADPERRGLEERGWLLFAVVVAFLVLAFAGMIVLTALGGGTTYVR
jgi:hypothetical protein